MNGTHKAEHDQQQPWQVYLFWTNRRRMMFFWVVPKSTELV